jgi:hypothetical protein
LSLFNAILLHNLLILSDLTKIFNRNKVFILLAVPLPFFPQLLSAQRQKYQGRVFRYICCKNPPGFFQQDAASTANREKTLKTSRL